MVYNPHRVLNGTLRRRSVDLNALAWLEDYLQTWAGTILVVYVSARLREMFVYLTHRDDCPVPMTELFCKLQSMALEKKLPFPTGMPLLRTLYISIPIAWIITRGAFLLHFLCILRHDASLRNFTQFYATKSERDRNMRKEYETQVVYRQHLQAFIDRWRYNANRG